MGVPGHGYAPGESPFHVKGGLYIGTQNYFIFAMKLPRMLTQVFDFGAVEVTRPGPRFVQATLSGFPAILSSWYVNAFDVYAETALKEAGAGLVGVQASAPTRTETRHNVDLVRLTFEVRWGGAPAAST